MPTEVGVKAAENIGVAAHASLCWTYPTYPYPRSTNKALNLRWVGRPYRGWREVFSTPQPEEVVVVTAAEQAGLATTNSLFQAS